MLKEGDLAPDFTCLAHSGETVKLSELRGKRVLLWFYPMADTPG
jgi:peroxiredoxin Q/BCP